MATEIEQKPIDKSTWGDGPWQHEPDRVEFEHAGLPCLMVRNTGGGNWCGYAAVPAGHPDHGKDMWEVEVEVHGGVTYTGECREHICHVPKPGEPDNVWWFGFDCAHAWDFSPGYAARYRHDPVFARSDNEEYRDAVYVRRQVEQLAGQLAAKMIGATVQHATADE